MMFLQLHPPSIPPFHLPPVQGKNIESLVVLAVIVDYQREGGWYIDTLKLRFGFKMPWLMLNDRPSFSLQRTYKIIQANKSHWHPEPFKTIIYTKRHKQGKWVHHYSSLFLLFCWLFLIHFRPGNCRFKTCGFGCSRRSPHRNSIVFKDTQIIHPTNLFTDCFPKLRRLEKVVLGGSLHRQALLHVCLEPRPIKLEDLEHLWMLIGVMVLNPEKVGPILFRYPRSIWMVLSSEQ